MRIHDDGFLHLTYCTNIHPATGWDGVLANLQRVAPGLKARLSPSQPFGLGLRVSAREARELLDGERLTAFKAFLDGEGLYVAVINGFPYGAFHGTPVKTNVYAPDWRDDARVTYTLDLIEILRQLVPRDVDGGISTSPLSYKAWMATAGEDDWAAITTNVVRIAERLVRVRQEDGVELHLDIEPEPDCALETTEETIDFFEQRLFRQGADELAARLGTDRATAREAMRDHIRVCFDCCHAAVEFETATAAIGRLRRAGVRIGRIQLSSALKVSRPADRAATAASDLRLGPFVEPTYLHQVVERRADGLTRFADLDVALQQGATAPPNDSEWRIHFHVPLFMDRYGDLGSTQDVVRDALAMALRERFTRHLEIETYTWDVLPPDLKMDVTESIAREYAWVRATIDAEDRRT